MRPPPHYYDPTTATTATVSPANATVSPRLRSRLASPRLSLRSRQRLRLVSKSASQVLSSRQVRVFLKLKFKFLKLLVEVVLETHHRCLGLLWVSILNMKTKQLHKLASHNWTLIWICKSLFQNITKILYALQYWKDNKHRFMDPTLMICVVLSIPITTMASKSAFSISSHVLNKY